MRAIDIKSNHYETTAKSSYDYTYHYFVNLATLNVPIVTVCKESVLV